MKKILPRLIILTVSLIVHVIVFAETSNLITQLKVIDNDTTFRYLYYYDSNNNKVLETKYYLKNSLWYKMTQTEWLYNNNKCEIQRERIFVLNDWVTNYEINYTYEDEKLISESHSKYVNGMSEQYKLVVFTYENLKLKTKKEFFKINDMLILKNVIENTYENDQLKSTNIKKISSVQSENKEYNISFNYNTGGILVSQLMEEKASISNWMNVEMVNWYYDVLNKMTSQRTKKWNQNQNIWENSTMIKYDYDTNNKLVSEIYYKWSSMFWERTTKYVIEYNTNGSLLSTTLFFPIYRQWRSVSSINYSNFVNEKANKMETVLSFWGGDVDEKLSADIPFQFNNETEIKRGSQIIISYEKIDNTDIQTFSMNNDISIKIYPNPSEDYFYFNPEDYQVLSWVVYDLKGQIVIENKNNLRSGIIDLSNSTKGVYLLKMTTTEKVLTQKLIKK